MLSLKKIKIKLPHLLPKSDPFAEHDSDEVGANVAEWIGIVVFTLLITGLMAWYAVGQFIYWSHLEDHLSAGGGDNITLDTKSMETLIKETEDRAAKAGMVKAPVSTKPTESDSNPTVKGSGELRAQ